MSPKIRQQQRRQCIPIVYTTGTHYEVGFNVGRTFGSMIQNFLKISAFLNDELLPAYATREGKRAYDATLNTVKTNFPQYVRELEGTADGAGVPFHKLFLFHLDQIIINAAERESNSLPVGCSTVCVNEPDSEILGHTEDALKSTINHYYLVSAHIISDKPEGRWGVVEEKFTSLCYAGHLPGYTMSYNHHGMVFTINTITANTLLAGRTPRTFLTRALLASENFMQAQQILRDAGCGAGDGCSINMTFLLQEGDRMFHNVEMGPAYNENMSQLNILTVSPREFSFHCNSYQRLSIPEPQGLMIESSKARLSTISEYTRPANKKDVERLLGDESHNTYTVYQDSKTTEVKTIAVGIFDCKEKTWSLYSDNPANTDPLVVLPLVLKKI